VQVNALPPYDASDDPTQCCPRFNPEGWNDRHLHFDHKPFVRARTRSLFHIPLNMVGVFKKTFAAIEAEHANNDEQVIVLSLDSSPWSSTHLFSVKKEVPGQDNVELSGDFVTRVFEGPYKHAPRFLEQMHRELADRKQSAQEIYFFYTTCPKCSKAYGKNYMVAITRLGPESSRGPSKG
jgi:hypothetical protein